LVWRNSLTDYELRFTKFALARLNKVWQRALPSRLGGNGLQPIRTDSLLMSK